MGGNRCTFRGCPNNRDKCPGLGFSKYPWRYPDRVQKWCDMSGDELFRRLSAVKLRSHHVCKDHFKTKMFTNVLRDIIRHKKSLPTLLRLATGEVIDLEVNELYKTKINYNTKFDSTEFGDLKQALYTEDRIPNYYVGAKNYAPKKEWKLFSSDEEEDEEEEDDDDNSYFDISDKDQDIHIVHDAAVEMVNFGETESFDQSTPSSIERIVNIKQKMSPQKVKVLIPKAKKIKPDPSSSIQFVNVEEVLSPDPDPEDPMEDEEYEEKPKRQKMFIEDESIDQKKSLEFKFSNQKCNASVQADIPLPSTSNAKPPPLTKPQVFSSLKRYLSPALASLVKMEMFGGSERPWKNDEKQVSVELLNLGEGVYDYFVDEWRVRLPEKKEVAKWQQETFEEEDY